MTTKFLKKIFKLALLLPATAFANTTTNHLQQQLSNLAASQQASTIVIAARLPNGKVITASNNKNLPHPPYFAIASITKTFTAALINELISQNKLHWTDKVGQFFPEYPKWQDITIAMLLNQSSGIPDYIYAPHFFDDLDKNPNKLLSAKNLLDLAYQQKSSFEAGDSWSYSNTNYLLLGLIAEKAGHKTLPHLYKQYLFASYDLKNSHYFSGKIAPPIQRKLITGYNGDRKLEITNMTWLQSAGGIISTSTDLIKWGEAIYLDQKATHYFQNAAEGMISLDHGAPAAKDYSIAAYNSGIFRINTSYGVMWYTPGLGAGDRDILAYLPCQGLVIAGSINNSATKMSAISKLLNMTLETLLKDPSIKAEVNHYQSNSTLPTYCQLPKAKTLDIPWPEPKGA